MTLENRTDSKQEKLRADTLSDVLKAEVSDRPLEWPRYRASHPNRMNVLDELNSQSLIQVENNLCLLTFYGLVRLRTGRAKKLLVDCRKVFDALAKQYTRHLNEWIDLGDIAERIRLAPERVRIVVLLFQRRGAISVSATPLPVTIDSKLAGTELLLRDGPFQELVKRTREMLDRNALSSQSMNFPEFPSTDRRTDLLTATLTRLGCAEVLGVWEKCIDRVDVDSDGAITSAKSLVEGACKQVLEGRNIPYASSTDLPRLYGLVAEQLELDPGKEPNDALKRILSGCVTSVNGLAALRNIHGDSHGKAPGSNRPAQRHARLAVTLASAFAAFLLETDEGRKRP